MKLFFFILYLSCLGLTLKSGQFYSIVKNGDSFEILDGKQQEVALAWGILDDKIQTTGWGILSLFTNHFQTNEIALAAGYLEGVLTQEHIYMHKNNLYDELFEDDLVPSQKIADFLIEQYQYTNHQVQENPNSQYWKTIGLFQSYLIGLLNGYNSVASEKLELLDFLVIQANGDLFDLIPAMDQSKRINWQELSREQLRIKFLSNTHCSVIIKIPDDLSDVFMSHTSWDDGNCMLRIYKFYQFGQDFVQEQSSYPGSIYSADDYYVLPREDQKLYISETSNSIFNYNIYQSLTYKSLLCWQRVLVANMLAHNGYEWTELFKLYNSGTYNNQYMIVDTKNFHPGELPRKNFIWIIETMPKLSISKDVTQVFVKQGNYWPSYNIPYFKQIWLYAGYDQLFKKYGDEYSYENCPRAQILRRDHSKVQTLDDEKQIIRYNNYKNDPLSLGDPLNAIAARGDLLSQPIPFFAFDAKVTTYQRIANNVIGLSDIQAGPTHDNQPVFRWSDFDFDVSHQGQPDEFNFDWITVSPHY